jgi:hypothetical protein
MTQPKLAEFEKTCKRNPQMPPHKHKRENGVLVCIGYQPTIGESKIVAEPTKRYVSE